MYIQIYIHNSQLSKITKVVFANELSSYLSVNKYGYIFMCIYICIYFFIYLSICLSVNIYIHVHIYVCVSIYVYISISIYLSCFLTQSGPCHIHDFFSIIINIAPTTPLSNLLYVIVVQQHYLTHSLPLLSSKVCITLCHKVPVAQEPKLLRCGSGRRVHSVFISMKTKSRGTVTVIIICQSDCAPNLLSSHARERDVWHTGRVCFSHYSQGCSITPPPDDNLFKAASVYVVGGVSQR